MQNIMCAYACACVCVCVCVCAVKPYLCPSSCATVKASGRPVSSLMLQLRCDWHIPATWDRPSVSHGTLAAAQMSFLWIEWRVSRVNHENRYKQNTSWKSSCIDPIYWIKFINIKRPITQFFLLLFIFRRVNAC